MVGSLHPTPIATLPFLSPHSAVVAFCEGILKHGTAWEALREDLASKMTLEEVRERMRNVLSLTDVTRFPIPKNPESVILVAATVSKHYQPNQSYYLLAYRMYGWILMVDRSIRCYESIHRMMGIYRDIQCWSFRRPGLGRKFGG